MCNSIEQHRVAIGRFAGSICRAPGIHTGLTSHFCSFWLLYLLVTCMNLDMDPYVAYLLTLGMDIEKNPGPTVSDDYLKLCNMNRGGIEAERLFRGETTF